MVFQFPPCHPLFFVLFPLCRFTFPLVPLPILLLSVHFGDNLVASFAYVYCPGIACRSSHLAVYSSPLPWRRAAGFVHSVQILFGHFLQKNPFLFAHVKNSSYLCTVFPKGLTRHIEFRVCDLLETPECEKF